MDICQLDYVYKVHDLGETRSFQSNNKILVYPTMLSIIPILAFQKVETNEKKAYTSTKREKLR